MLCSLFLPAHLLSCRPTLVRPHPSFSPMTLFSRFRPLILPVHYAPSLPNSSPLPPTHTSHATPNLISGEFIFQDPMPNPACALCLLPLLPTHLLSRQPTTFMPHPTLSPTHTLHARHNLLAGELIFQDPMPNPTRAFCSLSLPTHLLLHRPTPITPHTTFSPASLFFRIRCPILPMRSAPSLSQLICSLADLHPSRHTQPSCRQTYFPRFDAQSCPCSLLPLPPSSSALPLTHTHHAAPNLLVGKLIFQNPTPNLPPCSSPLP